MSAISRASLISNAIALHRWKWGSAHPSGTVAEIVEEGSAKVKSNKVRLSLPASSVGLVLSLEFAGECDYEEREGG